jgi:hypothetical protein
MERKGSTKVTEISPMAISLATVMGSHTGTIQEARLENDEVVIESECTVCRAGLHDTTYTLYTEDNDHEIFHPEFPSRYQVAKLHSGGFFRVLAQDSAEKDDVQHLLLSTPQARMPSLVPSNKYRPRYKQVGSRARSSWEAFSHSSSSLPS